MIKGNGKKGYILQYIDSFNSKPIEPRELEIEVNNVKKNLGDVLDSLSDDTFSTQKELDELKISYRTNMRKLIGIIEVLTNQTELNNMNINDLKAMKEEIKDEE